MKKQTIFLFVLMLCVLPISCDDSFLENNKKTKNAYELDTPLFVQPQSDFTEVSITLPKLKNKNFKVIQYPKIIHFDSFDGYIDETGKMTYKIKVDEFDNPVNIEPQTLGHIILDVEDFGLLSINVLSLNHGTSSAGISETSIDFDITRYGKGFIVSNSAEGILFYKLTQKPEWLDIRNGPFSDDYLKINEIKHLYPNSEIYLSATPKVEGLTPGIHEGEVVFETSDPNNPILKLNVKIRIRSYENPESIKPIEGVVIDAEFDKNTNTAIFITHNPSKLISYNVDTQEKKERSLDKRPYTIGLSSDAATILLGQNEGIEFIDFSTLTTKESFELPYIVTEIIDGENGHYYYSNKEGEVFSLNTASKEIKRQSLKTNYDSKIEADILLKVKGRDQLVFSRSRYSPNGFYLIDASVPDDLKFIKYWHESFGKKLFTSEDFKYLFSEGFSHIYKFPDEHTGETFNIVGELNFQDYRNKHWIHHAASTSSIWLEVFRWDDLFDKKMSILLEYNDKNYDLKRSIKVNEYVTTKNGVKDYYETVTFYLFATKDGQKLFLIKNIDDIHPLDNAWHFEVIDVSN